MNPTKQQAFEKISSLVERFREHVEEYKRGAYNEHMTRVDYINPFFKALGWDMDNEQGHAEAYREVIHEDKVKVGGATKAPDYAFTLYGQRKFFVDAKKPGINIKGDIGPAYQVRRYGWSAKVALSVVTDFEEFAIYDCTKKPNPGDKSSVSRIKYLTFEQYLEEFDFLWDIFAKENLPKGRFDKYVQSDTGRKGTTTVDEEFLKSIEQWRTYLATSIALRNKSLSVDELNYAVQKTIDRIIFLRMCEDRGVETYGLLRKAAEKGEVYPNLFELFHTADEKYNSGLFDFKEDRITRELIIDNKVLKVIIGELYYPKCEYEFSVMPADILGSVYERFLGKTIRLTVGHQAKVEEKPEVRKAGGVYYTPKYIVDYIVENTVGKLLEGKTPKDAEKLRICDPACGSGSFLIGAYQYLLDWHLRYNLTPGPSPGRRGEKNRALTPDGHLTTALKKRILLNNIYGVDIDPQAVEVTKLNLLLKALEGETQASINQQMTLFHERVLPNLSHNIQCGNSLIGPDFYDNQFDLFPDQMKKINAFDWQRAFPEVFTGGGFDCVIGNPPYGALFQNADITYLKSIYQTAVWRVESYLMFIEKGINLLTRSGLLGYIIPDTLTNLGFTRPVRQMLLKKSNLKEIVGLPSNVFNQATVDTIILITEKDLPSEEFNSSIVLVKLFKKKQTITSIENPQLEFSINTKEWYDQDSFNIKSDEQVIRLIKKISENRIQIKEIGAIYYGIKVYQTGKGNPPQTDQVKLNKPYTSDKQISSSWLPFFDGKHIGRYKIFWDNNNWINYGTWLAEPRPPKIFEGEKILIRKIIGKTIIATHTQSTSYCNTLLFILKITNSEFSYKCILAILNSLLIGWYFRKKFQISDDDTFPQIMIRDILQIPIPQIDERKSKELTKFVEELLSLNHAVMKVKLDIDIKIIQSKISYCEDRINSLVYELYGLTEEEREIVEGK